MPGILSTWQWDGEHLVPLKRHRRMLDEKMVIGEIYRLEVVKERSWQSHKHYFASVHNAYMNLPERLQGEAFAQSAEHLRKWALIKTGFSTSQTFACETEGEAKRWAEHLRPLDEFSIVVRDGSTVTVYRAKSQSYAHMDRDEFQKSKDAVLQYCATLLGTDTAALREA